MDYDYNLDGPYGMGSDDYRTLRTQIDGVFAGGPDALLELGSGASTFQQARDYPAARIHSLESDRAIHQSNMEQLLQKEPGSNASVIFAPVTPQFYRGSVFLCYRFASLPVDATFDVVIVDGPVERLYPKGRESALYFLFDRLRVGALIALDDFHRDSAKIAVNNWLTIFGDALEIVESTPSFVVLRKVGACSEARSLGAGAILRSYTLVLTVALRRIRSVAAVILRRH